MKKRIIGILASCIVAFSLTGCGDTLNANVENSDTLNSNILGQESFVVIGSGLYYDSATRIVYMRNYTYCANYVYTAYYAPNGLPYRYNPESNTFEEIKSGQ